MQPVLQDTLRFEISGTTDLVTSAFAEESVSPRDYHLGQNYPNPFNPSTRIRFTIPARQSSASKGGGHNSRFTSLKIYNLLGQEVATLVNEELGPGSYEVTWDATGFVSGVYFYRLEAGAFVETKKLLLLR